MKLLKMQTHSCTLYSAAMVLNEEPENLIKELGHDGLDVVWPDHVGAARSRGVSMQEVQDLCMPRGHALAFIEAYPHSISLEGAEPYPVYSEAQASERIYKILHRRTAILIGQMPSNLQHACAWDGQRVFDPQGRTYELEHFPLREVWLLVDC